MVILKYYEWMRITPDVRIPVYALNTKMPEWCKATGDFRIYGERRISREQALTLIEENNLHCVHSNKYGKIWV